jgi:hypothetical protein
MKTTFTEAELTPRVLASYMAAYQRQLVAIGNMRAEMSKLATRKHEIARDLAKAEEDIEESALFAEAYFLRHGQMD